MKILALDTATRSGWATYANGVYDSGVFDASIRTKATKTIPADHPGKRFHLFRDWLKRKIKDDKIDLLVYERVVGGAFAGGGTSLIQKALEAIIFELAYDTSYTAPTPVWSFSAGTIKKWATGSGALTNESKLEVMRLAEKEFKEQNWIRYRSSMIDDNQADALFICDLARAVVSIRPGIYSGAMNPEILDNLTKLANQVTARKWATRR